MEKIAFFQSLDRPPSAMQTLPLLDLGIILFSFLGLILFSIHIGKSLKSSTDYFVGKSDIPWWAICGSIVATETSTLSFIGVPAISFFGNLNFVQLLFGYVVGRFLVARLFLPRYFAGEMKTSYQLIGSTFGAGSQKVTSGLFLLTRLLGDGVRLFATALPLQLLTGWDLWLSVSVIMSVTILFTYFGGVKTIIWTDFAQFIIYMLGAILAMYFLMEKVSFADLSSIESSKWVVFNFDFSFSTAYTFYWAILGGVLLTLSSHGTDQLLVQRVLSAKSITDAKKAMITSGFVVFVQLCFFLLIGLMLYVFFQQTGTPFAANQRNEVFPYFIVHHMPEGITGIVIAAVFSAAISSLSSSLSAMASSTVFDLGGGGQSLGKSRLITAIWGVALTCSAALFELLGDQNVVALGLGIASILYGGVLGLFFIGFFRWKLSERAALAALCAGILPIFAVWVYQLGGSAILGWTLFIPIGMSLTLALGFFLRKKTP